MRRARRSATRSLQVTAALAYSAMQMNPKTFKLKSFGCQMNVYDGERISELLADQGLAAAAEGEDAELVVLNTCQIRE